MFEKIINVNPENVHNICKFLDDFYEHVGYGGGLKTIEKLYFEGISFKSTNQDYFLKNSPVKYEIIIKNTKNFKKEELNKLIKITGN